MSYTEKINVLYIEMKKRYQDLDTLKRQYDLIEQDILHYIEFEKYNAVIGSKLLKKIKR